MAQFIEVEDAKKKDYKLEDILASKRRNGCVSSL
jgi:hypothetical protein